MLQHTCWHINSGLPSHIAAYNPLAYAFRTPPACPDRPGPDLTQPWPLPPPPAVCCRELGYQVVEVNASDARGKSDAKASSGIGGTRAWLDTLLALALLAQHPSCSLRRARFTAPCVCVHFKLRSVQPAVPAATVCTDGVHGLVGVGCW